MDEVLLLSLPPTSPLESPKVASSPVYLPHHPPTRLSLLPHLPHPCGLSVLPHLPHSLSDSSSSVSFPFSFFLSSSSFFFLSASVFFFSALLVFFLASCLSSLLAPHS